MAQNTIGTTGDVWYFRGTLKSDLLVPSSGSIGDTQMDPNSPLDVNKYKAQYVKNYAQKRGTAVAGDTGTVIHVCYPAGSNVGTLLSFSAGICVAGVSWAGGGQLTVDLKKNGVSVLSSLVTITGSTTAFQVQNGTFSSTSYSNNDVFEVVTVFTAGTGTPAQGLFVQLVAKEPTA